LSPASHGWLALVALLATMIAAVSFYLLEPALALVSCLLGWTMLAVAAVDAREFVIPDVLSLPSIPAGLVVASLLDETRGLKALEHVGAALLGGAMLYGVRALYFRWRGREGLGLGDVKLAMSAGAWTGLAGLGPVLLMASLLAITGVLLAHLLRARRLHGSAVVALGVFLAPSIWLVWCASTAGLDLGLPELSGP
jgi:leader peptidase (prepilin peptidase)/N-methyltransferase